MSRLKLSAKAPPVRVVPNAFSIAEKHGVHRSQCARLWRELIQQRDHGLLRRVSNVESSEAVRFGLDEHVLESRSAAFHQVEIEEFVTHIESERFTLVHVHRRAR
jgi:hypothetical protein